MRPYSDPFRNHYAYTYESRAMYNRMPRQHDVQELLRKQSKNEFLTEEEKGVVQAHPTAPHDAEEKEAQMTIVNPRRRRGKSVYDFGLAMAQHKGIDVTLAFQLVIKLLTADFISVNEADERVLSEYMEYDKPTVIN